MNLFEVIKDIFKPAAELVDNVHTSTEEKLAAKAAILETQANFLEYALKYEQEQLEVKSRIIEAETKSEHWLTSTWRPVTMYAFLVMLLSFWFGFVEPPALVTEEILDRVFSMIQWGVGGYIASRGVEKVVPPAIEALKKN